MENDLRRMTQLGKELEPLREECQAKLDDLAITYPFPGMQSPQYYTRHIYTNS